MNLLKDPWIPVKINNQFRHITFNEVLCKEEDRQISVFRDDMELAALQLLICLTQVIFPPENAEALRAREQEPMDETEFNEGIKPYLEWFDLTHPKYPFMQIINTQAKKITPIQKLFVGLPEGNNHSFFNTPAEITQACGACVSVALFNQASNSPGFGGGFKDSLRGSRVAITTLISGKTLRKTIWLNVLHQDKIGKIMPMKAETDPVWIKPVKEKEKVFAHQTGLCRGLFWQPSRVYLEWSNKEMTCHACGCNAKDFVIRFKKEGFTYDFNGQWPHPHSPRQWKLDKGEKKESFASFTTTAPAWTQLNSLLIGKEEEKQGVIPAAVVSQYRNVFACQKLELSVGGYRNNKASVLERRHEIFSLPAGWEDNLEKIEEIIGLALEVKEILHNKKLYRFGEAVGGKKSKFPQSFSKTSEELFYQHSESLIHEILREMDWKEIMSIRRDLAKKLVALAKRIFDDLTRPFCHDPKFLKSVVMARHELFEDLNKKLPERRKHE
ncbi:MAG: type I-E CRISPR-associated protein Cse1/CasA [Nitrospinales bacterium]